MVTQFFLLLNSLLWNLPQQPNTSSIKKSGFHITVVEYFLRNLKVWDFSNSWDHYVSH